MNTPFRPAFVKPLDHGFVGWIAETNQYVLSENPFSDEIFVPPQSHASSFQLDSFEEPQLKRKPDTSGHIEHSYQIGHKVVALGFQNQKLHDVFGRSMAHLAIRSKLAVDLHYDFIIQDESIQLFKNKILIREEPIRRYHFMQANFANEMISTYNGIDNSNWLASFHASALQKNDASWLLLGHSGSGKSTLAAILNAKGFKCMADDLVLMHQSDGLIYPNPAGISVKVGSWQTLKHFYPELEHIQDSPAHKKSESVKYLPIHLSEKPPKPLPCQQLVWVNFRPQHAFKIKLLTHFEALQKLIPDTWIDPSVEHAQQFLEWLVQTKCWFLSYSNYQDVLSWFNDLAE